MAQLIVRNLEEPVVQALKQQAARHGRSAEEEHRVILRTALLAGTGSFADALAAIPQVGNDEDFAREPDTDRPVDL